MPDVDAPSQNASWNALYTTAAAQTGYFTTAQAQEAGYYPQLLQKYVANGKIERVRRGVYRLVHFPAAEHEELVVLWLWSEQTGTFSHQTALALHDLSDALPARVHMTVPLHWRKRRLRVPEGLILHHADLDDRHRQWFDAVPVTSPMRTLRDCIDDHVSPELIRQANAQARQRGLLSRDDEVKLTVLLDVASEV